MTKQERVRARKAAARKERIRQAKAVKRAQPGGLAGAGITAPALAEQVRAVPEDAIRALGLQLEGAPARTDVAEWAGEVADGT